MSQLGVPTMLKKGVAGMQRWPRLMAVLAIMAMLATATAPQTATKAHAQAGRNWSCRVPGVGGEYYCFGTWDVGPGSSVRVCVTFVTYGNAYPGGVYLRENSTRAILGSAEMYEGQCKTLYYNNSGGWKSVYLSIDSRSYGYTQEFVGVFDTFI
jgi:hypothetical protein